MHSFGRLPHAAAWRHEESKDGFEVVFFAQGEDGIRIAGETTAVEEGEPFWVGYELELDPLDELELLDDDELELLELDDELEDDDDEDEEDDEDELADEDDEPLDVDEELLELGSVGPAGLLPHAPSSAAESAPPDSSSRNSRRALSRTSSSA